LRKIAGEGGTRKKEGKRGTSVERGRD